MVTIPERVNVEPWGMLHVVKAGTDRFDLYRGIAPWISGFEMPLRYVVNDAAVLTTPAEAPEWHAVLVPGLGVARRRAAIERWRQGPAVWQRWADEVRALRAEIAIDARAERFLAWLTFADFSYQVFPQTVDFSGADLPAGASFAAAQFLCDAWFCGGRFGAGVDFRGAQFASDVFFEDCWFEGRIDFEDATFSGSAQFSSSRMLRSFSARKARFRADAWLRACQFFGPVDFAKARIAGEAGLGNCYFAQDVDFSEADFADNVGFEDSVFASQALFEHAAFGRHARFGRARFEQSPCFRAARFFGACHFDDTTIPILPWPITEKLEEIEQRFRNPCGA
jgi:uncharacterized protein YjbI with pentapeptide repeats